MDYILQLKMAVIDLSTLDRDSLHIHVSIIAFLIACFVLRRKASSILPWLAVLALAIFGEYVDALNILKPEENFYASWDRMWHFHGKDIINTMIAPTILGLTARYTRLLEKPVKLPKKHASENIA